MKSTHPILLVAACGALAALGWFAWRSANAVPAPIALAEGGASSSPSAEKFAALDAAETQPAPSVESGSAPTRAAVEVRTIQSRTASITVQPPKIESENRGMIIVWCYVESSHASVAPEEIVLVASDGHELRQRPGQDQDTFRGLAPGLYTVLVRDARFETVSVDSVTTGSHVLIDLLGTARVRVLASDAESGASIDPSSLRLIDFGREKELAPDAQGWFEGLPGGEVELRVAAPGYQESKLVLSGLRLDESREVELRFVRGREIRGVVVSEANGFPVANVQVWLGWERDPQVLLQTLDLSSSARRFQLQPPSARSDREGRFEFRDLPAGRYRLSARASNLVAAPDQEVLIGDTDRIHEVSVRLPSTCSLTGALESAGAAPPESAGLQVQVQVAGDTPDEYASFDVADVLPSGCFAVRAGLPVGRVRVLLAVRSRESQFGRRPGSPGTRVLGELELHAGENECRFDITDMLPGTASVELAESGFGMRGKLLIATADGRGEAEECAFQESPIRVGPLPAGDYQLLLQGATQDWMSSTPVQLHIESGKDTALRLDVRLVPGRLQLQESDGEPLPQQTRIQVTRSIPCWPGGGLSISPTIDEEGGLALALEPGSFTLCPARFFVLERDDSQQVLALEWSSSGPAQPVLRLPAK